MKGPRPWFWKARGAWYVQVGKAQVRLHEDEKQAWMEFHRLMAKQGSRPAGARPNLTVAEAAERYLGTLGHLRPRTVRTYTQAIGPFAAAYRSRRLDSIRPEEVLDFVRRYRGRSRNGQGFGASSRAILLGAVKRLTSWARDVGLLDVDPLARLPNPWTIEPRQRAMTFEEYARVMACSDVADSFKEVLEFLWRGGMRPGELAAIEARHLDPSRPLVRLAAAEHKSGSKVGKGRLIVLPPDLMARLRGYAKVRSGPLLRNERGRPWIPDVIGLAWRRVRARLGLPKDLVAYQARHAFVTRMIDGGASPILAAKLAGHASTAMIEKHYYHPDVDAMIDLVGADDGMGELLRPAGAGEGSA